MNQSHGNPSDVCRERGFSLTELLVVLAILFMLAAIIVPTTASSRAQTRLQQCLANLQQVNRAVLLYAEEHQGKIPLLEPSPAPGGWWYFKGQVKGYLGLTGPSSPLEKVFACPEDRGYGFGGQEPKPFYLSKNHNYTSFVLNGVNLPGIPNVAGWPVASVKDPARTLLVMEWIAHAPLSWHKSRTGRQNSPFYNNAESVVGFVDGHVSLTKIHYDGMNAAYTRDPVGGYDYKYSGK
jgi:prepilin-type N-terminal cleavage/methylation domain-containing protein/prepilin-type processing-associated H-X9-DG protein